METILYGLLGGLSASAEKMQSGMRYVDRSTNLYIYIYIYMYIHTWLKKGCVGSRASLSTV